MIIDIIILAIIVAIIFYKLNTEFGKISDQEKDDIEAKIKNQSCNKNKKGSAFDTSSSSSYDDSNQVRIVGQSSTDSDPIFQHDAIVKLPYIQKRQLINVLQSINIDLDFFLKAAKSTFEMVIDSFSNGNMEDVKHLCSDAIFNNLTFAKQQRQSLSQKLFSKIVNIDNIEIVSFNQIGNDVLVSILFSSQQINFTTNSSGEVIKGSKEQIEKVNDKWTFSYNFANKSTDQTWYLTATH